jgi:hypothetical protein
MCKKLNKSKIRNEPSKKTEINIVWFFCEGQRCQFTAIKSLGYVNIYMKPISFVISLRRVFCCKFSVASYLSWRFFFWLNFSCKFIYSLSANYKYKNNMIEQEIVLKLQKQNKTKEIRIVELPWHMWNIKWLL